MSFGASPDFKDATMYAYTRISTDKQTTEDKKQTDAKKKTTLKRQFKEINDALKAQGLPQVKPSNWFAEIASGTRVDRPQWLKLREAALNHEGKAVIVVKDPSRWARNVDAAVNAWTPLKERGIPVYAVITGIQTGTAQDIRPSENFFFLLNSGFAAQTSEVQKKKATEAIKRQRAEGAADFKGRSLFPFARVDPYDAIIENMDIMNEKKGKARFRRVIEQLTMPNGVKVGSVDRIVTDINKLRTNMKPQEFEDYLNFRRNIRDRMKDIGYDAWGVTGNDRGKLDFKSNALYRMTGLYLKDPINFKQPSQEFIEEVLTDFPRFLSDKDKKRRSKK
jgi:DNA invertase Pin-like site-specific DNA recombinase